MSDYGFKTNDATNKIALNAKNPIFGFDMGHKPRAFKTFRITDAKINNPVDGGTPVPTPVWQEGWTTAENSRTGIVRELIRKVEHGYNFRPVGYATITGTLKWGRRIKITQTQYAGSWGGNYSRTFDNNTDVFNPSQANIATLIPCPFNKIWLNVTSPGTFGPKTILNPSDFTGTTWNYGIEYYFASFYGEYSFDFSTESPIEIEIDDKYIYFYRKFAWWDEIRRAQMIVNNYKYDDLQERVQIVDHFSGSQYNVTVYLCPYPLKELL